MTHFCEGEYLEVVMVNHEGDIITGNLVKVVAIGQTGGSHTTYHCRHLVDDRMCQYLETDLRRSEDLMNFMLAPPMRKVM